MAAVLVLSILRGLSAGTARDSSIVPSYESDHEETTVLKHWSSVHHGTKLHIALPNELLRELGSISLLSPDRDMLDLLVRLKMSVAASIANREQAGSRRHLNRPLNWTVVVSVTQDFEGILENWLAWYQALELDMRVLEAWASSLARNPQVCPNSLLKFDKMLYTRKEP